MSDKDGYDGWYRLRQPCVECGCTVGRLQLVNGQFTVRCEICGRFAFNVPKAELGIPNAEPTPVVITSKWPGRCKECGEPHVSGERVSWTRGVKGVACLKCAQGSSGGE